MPIHFFSSTHCINDFDLGESELSGGNCEERRELKPNGDVSDHDTVIISQHEVINNTTICVFVNHGRQIRSPIMGIKVFAITLTLVLSGVPPWAQSRSLPPPFCAAEYLERGLDGHLR